MELIATKYNVHQNRTHKGVIAEDFGKADSKGRALGARAHLIEADRVILEANMHPVCAATFRDVLPAAHVFGFCPQAMRGGAPFGAVQRDRYFETAEARDQAVAKYLADAKKRATKKA